MSRTLEEQAFSAALRQALIRLYDVPFLRRSPLVRALGLEKSLNTAEALRFTLQEAIERLKPAPDMPADSKNLRYYHILFYRYVQQSDRQNVARRLGLSVRHMTRESQRAIEALAEQLYVRAVCPRSLSSVNECMNSAAEGDNLGEEISWLSDSLPNEVTEVMPALDEVVHLVEAWANSNRVTLIIRGTTDAPLVAAIPSTVLRQIVLNLATTAIRSISGGQLAFTAQPECEQIVVRIEASTVASSSSKHLVWDEKVVGISRRIAKLFGGSLSVAEDTSALMASVMLPTAKEKIILGIEDNADTLQLWDRYVQGSRFRLVRVHDPVQALRMTIRLQPSLVILDVMMPDIDGWELLGQMHHHPSISHIPVIVCTILPQRDLALSLGANGFIQKPATRRDFLVALEQTVAAARTSALELPGQDHEPTNRHVG